jgi:hypothetical protein
VATALAGARDACAEAARAAVEKAEAVRRAAPGGSPPSS